MNLESITRTYRRYARHYDMLFGPILHHGRKLVVDALALQPGDRVLEVGVGTGLSLPMYPPGVKITGIDISTHMLDLARARVLRDGLDERVELLEMDAGHLRFANGSFDKVVAMYVMSVVPHPVQVINEMRRVCQPSGEIFIVNHFHSRLPLIRAMERLLAPLSRWAGFRPDMELTDFIQEAQLDVIGITNANLFGYWQILRCRVAPAAWVAAAGQDAALES